MMLMKGGKTSKKWKSYPVKIIETFDSYETAAAKEIQIFMSESENYEDSLRRRGKRLKVDNKKYTQSWDFNNDSDNSSHEENVSMGVYKKSTSVEATSNSTISCSYYNNIISTDYKTLCGAVESSLNYIRPSTLQLIDKNFENDTDASQNIRPSTLQLIDKNFENDTDASQNMIPTKLYIDVGHSSTTCSEFCNATNIYLSRLDKKLDLVLERLNYSLNSRNLISSIGDTSMKNFVKRVLARLFTNKLASECSWSGFKNNFRLDNLTLIMTVKDSTKKSALGLIKKWQTKHKAVKAHLCVICTYEKGGIIDVVEAADKYLQTSNYDIFPETNLDEIYKEMKSKILYEHERVSDSLRGSQWVLVSINTLNVAINKYAPIKGSSYIPTPVKIVKRKSVLNVKN
ncbi:hypothetical protein ACI65C_013614 [Semiaphis heraclei]